MKHTFEGASLLVLLDTAKELYELLIILKVVSYYFESCLLLF